jgi:hypothetical protein
MKTCGGVWRYSSTILDLGLIGGELSASRPGRHCYPLGRRLDWAQTQSQQCGEEKNLLKSLAPAGNRTPAAQPVARFYTD